MSEPMPRLDLIAEQCLAPVPGGTGRYTVRIGAGLAATAPAGWSVRSVTAWHRDVGSARIPGVRGPCRLPVGRRVLVALWERGLPPWPAGDSVQAGTPLSPPRRGVPLVATVHDVVPWTHPETLTPRGVRWHRAMIGRLAEQADAMVVPTNAVADALADLFPAAAKRIHPIAHGVTALPVPADAAERRQRLGLPDRFLMTLATIEPRKGLDVLIEALASPAVGDLPLLVVGQPGWGGVDLVGHAQRHGLDPARLFAPGRLSDTDLAAALAGACALVVPSRAEGFGLPVLEGMAAGVPVIHTTVPSLVEVAGGAGLAAPIGDADALAAAVRDVISDPGRAAAMRTAGVRRAAEFSWEKSARQLWKLHLQVGGAALP